MISGGVLLLLCLVPGLPWYILLLFGGLLIFLGNRMEQKQKSVREEKSDTLAFSETEFYKDPDNVYTTLGVEPIEMEFGYSLIPVIDEQKGAGLIDRVVVLRRKFAEDMGFVIPSVRLRDNAALDPGLRSQDQRGNRRERRGFARLFPGDRRERRRGHRGHRDDGARLWHRRQMGG
jgi:flagellar biosynthesis protein FlhA